jgi:transposase-like protein
MLAKQEGVNWRRLCQQFGISAQTGYKWIELHDAGDICGFLCGCDPATWYTTGD